MQPPRPGGPEDLFHPLSPRLATLLATMFTRGGEDDLHLLDLLPDDDAFALQEKSEQLVALEPEARVSAVVRELRRQVQFAGLVGLDAIDASWLLAGVRGEQPHTIGIILAQLSANPRSRILRQLPPSVRERVPGKEELQQRTRPEVLRIVRQIFESRFVTMPVAPSEPTELYFKDIGLLEARELSQLIRALGIEQLAAAFLTVGRRKLAELCARLGEDAAAELIEAVKELDPQDALDIEQANEFLSRVALQLSGDRAEAGDFQRALFQKAGLFRLAQAVQGERPAFVQQLGQRLPRSHGRLLKNYVFNTSAPLPGPQLRRLQDMVLYRVEKLAARGKVNPRYLKFTFCYWGEEGEEGADGEQPEAAPT